MKVVSATVAGLVILESTPVAQTAPAPLKPSSLLEVSSKIRSLSRRISPAVVQLMVSDCGSLDHVSGSQVSLFSHAESTGLGVIVDPEGYIVTNTHVVRGAVHTRVVLTRPTP